MFLTIVYVHTLPAIAPDTDLENSKDSDTSIIERFDLHSFLNHHPFEDSTDEDELIDQKRQVKKKWSKLQQGNPSPYTIAFPALIRTRRDMEEEKI